MNRPTDQEIASWYTEQTAIDPFNPPTIRRTAAFMGVRSSETAYKKLRTLESAGLIAGRRKWPR